MQDQGLDLWGALHILRRWGWIVAIGVIGATLAAFIVTRFMTPIYESEVKVLVEGGNTIVQPSLVEIRASQALGQIYVDLIRTRPFLLRVIRELSLPYEPRTLSKKLSISAPGNLIKIKVRDPDAQLAARIGNTTAEVFMDDFRRRQIEQINQIRSSLRQNGLKFDPTIIAAQVSKMSRLSIIEAAQPSPLPSSPRMLFNIVVAAVFGLMGGCFVIFLLERLDNRVRSQDELKFLTGVPNLGLVRGYKTRNSRGIIIFADAHELSGLTESYRFLSTNLEFAAVNANGIKTLLVTSSSPKEGKTTTAANLAISLANEGKSVILVDFDLRKPALHSVFDLRNQIGLAQVLAGGATLEEALSATQVKGLQVITGGPVLRNVTEFLHSPKMNELVEQLKDRADLVIFDTPPLLAVTDPMLLAPLVDGALLVVDARRADRKAVTRGAEILQQAELAVAGTVLNKVTAKDMGDHYYPYPDYSQESNGQPKRVFGLLSKGFGNGKRAIGGR